MQTILANTSRLRRFSLAGISLIVVALTTAGCGQSSGSQGQSPNEPTHTTNRSSTQNNASFPMPVETGKGLQEAQDDVQRVSGNPLFITNSSDATGAGRARIIDSNWQVCSQNVPPGTSVNQNTHISFAAVKLDENCP